MQCRLPKCAPPTAEKLVLCIECLWDRITSTRVLHNYGHCQKGRNCSKQLIPFFTDIFLKHRKNCECCHHHSVFKGQDVIVHIDVLICQKCNQCLKCQVSGHNNFQKIWQLSKNLTTFKKSENFPNIWKLFKNLKTFKKSEHFLKI